MMDRDDLLETLRKLEVEIHQIGTRRDRARLGALLHADFREVGRSGREYSREEVLSEFADISEYPSIESMGYRLYVWAPGVALLSYLSAHRDGAGGLSHYTLRSSLWILVESGWQLAFHQGTPTTDGVWSAVRRADAEGRVRP
jgi:hypothetical protein